MFLGILEYFKMIWERISLYKSLDVWNNLMLVDMSVIGYWIFLLGCLLAFGIWFLSNKRTSRLLEYVSNNLLIVSFIIWLFGDIVYIIGFYREGLNWLRV